VTANGSIELTLHSRQRLKVVVPKVLVGIAYFELVMVRVNNAPVFYDGDLIRKLL
jgi:hypothetical protein